MTVRKYTLGTAVTVDVVFRQGGVATDPDSFDLVVAKPGDADTTYSWPDPPGPIGPIVRDGDGVFHADLLADVKGLWAYRFAADGPGPAASEGEFWVQSVVTDVLDLLIGAEDYDAIRNLLGVTKADVEDNVIESPVFGVQAELAIKTRIPTWEELIDDDEDFMRLRLATGYLTAALIAETFAHGGMIGLANDGRLQDRQWTKEAETLRAVSERWVVELLVSTTDTTVFDVPMISVAGPSRRAAKAPGAPLIRPSWANGYPIEWGGWTSVSGD